MSRLIALLAARADGEHERPAQLCLCDMNSDAVLWWQVGFGLALALLAVLAWRKAAAQSA